MLRGFRWQVLALLMAVGIFATAIIVRISSTPPVEPTPSLPTALASPTASTETTPSALTTTPVPTSPPIAAVQASPRFADGIPTLVEGVVGPVLRLNPLLAGFNTPEQDITALIFEGLARTNAFGEPVPNLAASWVISSDGLEYVVTLRPDVLWQDGTPLTVADVMTTVALVRAPDFPGSPELSEFWRTVETEALTELIVRFRLTQPLGTFLEKLTLPILPDHALRGTPVASLAAHPFNLTPIGTGPYQLEAIRAGIDGQIEAVDLRVAPNFRLRSEGQEHAYELERVRFLVYPDPASASAALAAGTIDALASQASGSRRELFALANDRDLSMYNQIDNVLGTIIFNWQRDNLPYFREQRIRLALETGLDRESIVDRLLANQAVPADSPLMPGSWAYEPNLPWAAYNPAAATALLQQGIERLERRGTLAGLSTDADPAVEVTIAPDITPTTPTTTFFSFALMTIDDPSQLAVANEIAAQWSQLNLSVRIDSVDRGVYLERLDAGDFDVALVELALGASGDPDMYPFWHQGQYPDGRNYGGVDDRRISELLERARRDPFGVNRAVDYRTFQREFVQRAIALPLYHPIFTYITTPRVAGVQLGFIGATADRFRNIGDWTIAP